MYLLLLGEEKGGRALPGTHPGPLRGCLASPSPGKPSPHSLPSERSRPSSLGPLWSLANLSFHSCFEIALCFITTPWCFVSFLVLSTLRRLLYRCCHLITQPAFIPWGQREGHSQWPHKALPLSPCSAESAGCWNHGRSWAEQCLFFSRGPEPPRSTIKNPGKGAASPGRVFQLWHLLSALQLDRQGKELGIYCLMERT